MEELHKRYRDLLGTVPPTLHERQQLAAAAHFPEALQAIEQFREILLHHNPLPRHTQQLVHLALLIGAREEYPALLHARAAVRAGATARELFGLCATAAVTGGMPSFTLAVHVVTQALQLGGDAGEKQ